MKILLGSDPEMFVYKDGEAISAHGMVDGTKDNPLLVKNGAVQVDGMALEYNTNPASNLNAWERNHVTVQQQLQDMIDEKLEIKATPTAFFSDEVFKKTPKNALVLGCEPDYNAYTGVENIPPNAKVKFRTGAGHIHIGWTKGEDINDPFHRAECEALVKSLDYHLGMPSLLIDGDAKRRELYGKAGAYRPKEYGLEYRTLSNFWIANAKLRKWVWDTTILAIKSAMDDDNNHRHSDRWGQIINSNDIDEAKWWCDHSSYLKLPQGY